MTTARLKPNFMSSLMLCAVFLFNMHFPQLLFKFKIFLNKLPKYLLFTFMALHAFFIPIDLPLLKLPMTTSPQKLFRSDCITMYISLYQIFSMCQDKYP